MGNNGVTLFAGDVGTGKTTHINAFIAHLGEEAIVANITLLVREELDFLNLMATDVGDYILHRLRVAGHEGNMLKFFNVFLICLSGAG